MLIIILITFLVYSDSLICPLNIYTFRLHGPCTVDTFKNSGSFIQEYSFLSRYWSNTFICRIDSFCYITGVAIVHQDKDSLRVEYFQKSLNLERVCVAVRTPVMFWGFFNG